MPVVQKVQRQVSLDRLPGVRKSAAENDISIGAGLAREKANTSRAGGELLGQVSAITGHAAIQMAQQAKQQADEVAYLDASNRFTEKMNDWQFNPQTGAYTKKGKDAQDLPNEFQDVFTKTASEVGDTLKTPEQRLAFQKFLAQQRNAIDVSVKRHVYGEMQAYDNAETKAALDNTISSAVANANSPAHVGVYLANGEAEVRKAAARNGLGAEATQQAVDDLRSKVHEGVIDRLLAEQNVSGAQAYFDELKGQLKGDALTRVEKAMAEGTVREQTQKETETIVAGGGTIEEQLARARKNLSGELEDRVVQELKVRDNEVKLAKQQRIEGIMVSGKNTIDKTGKWENIPPADWSQLTPAEAASLKSYAEQKRQGIPVKTDFATQYRLKTLAGVDPDAFVKENLTKYVNVISASDLDELANLQLSMRKGDTKIAEKQLGGFRTTNQVVDDTLGRYGFNPNAKPDTTEGQAVLLAREMLDRRVAEVQQLTKKEVPADQVQVIFQDILSQNVEVKGALWGTKTKPLVNLTIGDVGTHRPAVEQALRFAGRPVDEKSIVSFDAELRARFGGDIGPNAITRIPQQDVRDIAAALAAQKKAATPDAIVQLYIQLLAQGAVR